MTREEIAKLLSAAAAYDKRTIGDADVRAWHEVLARFDFEDAIEAVVDHYDHQTEPLMPAHVSAYCRKAGNDRSMSRALPSAAGVSDASAIARIRAQAPPYRVEDDDGRVLWEGPRQQLADLVNADPQARTRLAEPPLSFKNWSGYVPARLHDGKHNNSPVRRALLGIVADALARNTSNHHTERTA